MFSSSLAFIGPMKRPNQAAAAALKGLIT